VRCPRCGNENSEENRFCGMCGAKLLATPAAVTSTPAGVAAPVAVASSAPTTTTRSTAPSSTAAPVITRPQAAPPRASMPLPQDPPTISGPSFLGLNDPPSSRKRASLSTDPHSRSGNLDYLLEDEDEHRGGGAGKVFLILLALALAVGFGYLRWKNQGIPWLHLSPSKPAATAQNSDGTDTASPATAPSPDANAPAGASATPSNTTPAQPAAQGAPQQPAPDSSSTSAPPAATSPASTPDGGNPPANAAPATGDATKASSDTSNASPDSAAAAPAEAAKEPAKESAPDASDATPAPPPKPKKPAPAPKPHAGVSSTPSDPVSEAQKYIYGRGVTQDCERGMRLLKPAAAQANPKAMVEMGALYSAGLCTPHDLPTAYRWFAMALRKEPDNQAIQTDLQKLWSEMTQPERQLAIKLSQ